MRKNLLLLIALLLMISACNQSNEVAPVDNFAKEIAQLKTMHKDGLNMAVAALSKNLTLKPSNDLTLNERGLANDVLDGLQGLYFTASDEFRYSLVSSLGVRNLTANAQHSVRGFDFNQLYNENQKQLVQPFIDKLTATEEMYDAQKVTLDFQEKVTVSTLTREEKIKLLSLSTSILALIELRMFCELGRCLGWRSYWRCY